MSEKANEVVERCAEAAAVDASSDTIVARNVLAALRPGDRIGGLMVVRISDLERLASPEAFDLPRIATTEETARMKFAASMLSAQEGE